MPDSGRVLVVDLSSGATRTDGIDLRGLLGLGGKALGVRLLEEYLDRKVDPLDPENVVAITPSLLAAYSMSGANRFGAFTKSPLTGAWLESYCGGTFGGVLTGTGWDAVVIHGAATEPIRLHIEADGARLLPAAGLWGKDTFAAEDALVQLLNKRSAVLTIGVAGENLVSVASVMHDRAHALGRGGLGAVLGSKKLKAISATSPGGGRREAGEAFVRIRKEIAELAAESPAGAGYREFGTPAITALTNELGAFPTDFFTKGAAAHRSTLEAEGWSEWATREHLPCPPCPLRCRKRLTLTEGPEKGRVIHGAEYEAIFTFGGSCQVEHARDVARLSERCNRLGLDTMSGGNLVAVAIKAGELGLAGKASSSVSAPVPSAGDVEAIGELLETIASRSTPLGDTLAAGMDDALAALGMQEWSTTSKRLDPSGYEPRRLKGMALSNALSVRGACHLRAAFYKPDLQGELEGLDDDTFVRTYIDFEDRMLLLDSLTMCRFYRDFMDWERMPVAAAELRGAPVTKRDLETLANETLTRIRRFNLACGLTPADDTVAERFFEEPTDRAPALDRGELARRVRIYWEKRGWGKDGLPR